MFKINKEMIKELVKELLRGDFNYTKYWSRRHALFNPRLSKIKKFYYNHYVNRINIKFGASITHNWSDKDNFLSPPTLGHDILGLVIASDAIIGNNVFISHQVTIGASRGGSPTIGDNVYIGPGAKLFGDIKIGNNVRIGANCVVFMDVPDNATVVLEKPRVIVKENNTDYKIRSKENVTPMSWNGYKGILRDK